MPKQLKIFISYAHKDQVLFDQFLEEFKPALLQFTDYVWSTWEDYKIPVGEL